MYLYIFQNDIFIFIFGFIYNLFMIRVMFDVHLYCMVLLHVGDVMVVIVR